MVSQIINEHTNTDDCFTRNLLVLFVLALPPPLYWDDGGTLSLCEYSQLVSTTNITAEANMLFCCHDLSSPL